MSASTASAVPASGWSLRTVSIAVVVLAMAVAPLFLGKFGVSLMNDIGIGALVAAPAGHIIVCPLKDLVTDLAC